MAGASGVIYGVRLLEVLQQVEGVETHLIMSSASKLNLSIESDWSVEAVSELADVVHDRRNIAASIASGSFRTAGMIVVPCSMKTLSAIVNSYASDLLVRAADVVLKERRRLVVVPRESPLHTGHCRLMYEANPMAFLMEQAGGMAT